MYNIIRRSQNSWRKGVEKEDLQFKRNKKKLYTTEHFYIFCLNKYFIYFNNFK